jgi:hypothetical protein
MSDLKPYIPPKPKPRPGSLPMQEDRPAEPPHPAQSAVPPFIPADDLTPKEPKRDRATRNNLEKLKSVLRKAEELRVAVRDDAFDDWVRRYLVEASEPREWTQSRTLYENYLKRAKVFGRNRGDMALSKLELATETRFGILMRDAGITKKRRAKGWYYPVRLKQGA